ncbi:MAG: hypothetical protein J6B75_04655 [Ruminococcus sp.]|nr:hypothetical protein [Ruminococcus sp.]
MKKIKLFAAMTAMTLMCGCMDISSLIEPENKIEPPVRPMQNNMPSVTEVADELNASDWYPALCLNLLMGSEKTVVPEKVKNNDVKKALYQIVNDYPQIFWLGGVYYAGTVTDGSEIKIEFLDDFDTYDIDKMLDELDKAADEVISGIPDGSSDYEKALYVHDYLAENTEYDHSRTAYTEYGLWGSSYGCLVEKKAVCGGYAEAFHYIMQKLGIESGICTGSNHEWNYVKIDGDYYWVDVTWDDNDKGDVQHTYFLFTTDLLLRTRSFDPIQSFIPECTETACSYLVKNGGFFETYDEKAVLDYIGEHSDESHCEIMFGSFEAYEEALNSLLGKSRLYKADGVGLDGVSYYRNDKAFSLDIVF